MRNIESRFADIAGMRTHYLEGGRGPHVVLLHSGEFGGCAELSWEFTLSALAEHFHVIAPDWLGFGESAKIFSFDGMRALRVRHIAQFLQTLNIEKAHFIGNSMGGGMLAGVAAQDAPLWPIDRMILASAGGFAPVNEARRILNSYDGTREHMKRILETTLAHSPLRSDEAYLEKRHRLSLVPGSWECTAAARFRRPGVTSRDKEEIDYRNIKRPTLIVAGGKDPLREPGYGQELQTDIAGSELLVFPEAGHFPHIDLPERFNRAATAFLSR
ncbi:MAG TPA: alpha/beta hydrolase [Micropepsaceae bacterium]|jgi:pimeloyl-ACP methyl ester carboxylesterase